MKPIFKITLLSLCDNRWDQPAKMIFTHKYQSKRGKIFSRRYLTTKYRLRYPADKWEMSIDVIDVLMA